jgi:predicted RNA binding protein YcfA (HicA-like mRNA interferase family)
VTRLPVVTGPQLVNALKRVGFDIARIQGSHYIIKHVDGRMISVPVHGQRELRPGLLVRLLRDCRMSREELQKLL